MPEQSPSAILLDPSATAIRAVSPDAKRVLVSATRDPYLQGLSLVTRGEPTKVLVADGTYAVGFFTSDGKAIVFTAGNTGEARGPALQLARADGNGVQLLAARNSFYLAAGRWLYYTDESDTGFTLNRLMPPDGAPEVLATHSGAYNVYGAVHAISSPDGESIAYCRDSVPLDCHLRAVGSPSSVDLPDSPMRWAPDGSFLLTWACNMVDISGAARQLCDAPPSLISLSPDGSWIATRTTSGYHLIATSSGEDRLLPAPGPVDMNVFRPRSEIGFTPDSSRVIAILSHASFSIPTAGGSWTEISSDHGARGMSESDWPDVSPDSRIIADLAPSGSVVESIDGAPPEVIQAPHGQQLGWPNFEPAGGKAIFSRGWLANADGSGVLLHVPGEGYCQWARRTALCQVGHDDPLAIYSFDLVAVTDDGNQIVTLARNAVSWAVSGDSLFYVPNTGGLYVIDGLPRPAP